MRKVFRAPLMLLGGVVIALVLGSTSGVAIAAPAPAATSAGSAQRVCSTPSRGHMACMAYRRVDVKHPAGVQRAAATPSGYSPADLASAYNLPTGTAGAGETVAISIAFDNPHLESDLAVYRQQYGLPPCTTANGCFRKIDQRGGTDYPIADEQWGGESDLDVDMVSATCPQCHIVVVEADDNTEANLFAAIDQAVASGAQFVSNSWGGPEDPAAAPQLDAHFEHPGVAFTVSSGDFGFALEYPAFSQYVTAVGGTSLYRSSDARGFTESAWAGAGAGCADEEPKPSFQHDPLCPHRMEADVSAVADPQTGVAVYDNGWQVYGGTSVAAPVIAGVYALAGPASADQPANSYPYENPSALNDVTSGSDGYCPGVDYLCTAGPGYDGPTGLGTPDGITAFRHGAHGQVTGTIRDASTGAAVPGAKVSIAGADAITDDQGAYALSVPLGPSPVTVGKFGYDTATSSVEIGTDGQHVTLDLSLTPRPRVTVSGTLTDGSGHGWPLYGSVQVAGQPTTRVFTDPSTGAYRMSLPAGDTYTLQADPAYGGYVAASRDVTVGAADQSVDLSAGIDATACDAPGYAVHIEPALDEHFDGTGLPTGWTRNDFTGGPLTWAFDDPTGLGNRAGGSGGFAAIDGSTGNGGYQGSALTSPPLDLTGITHPVLTMRTAHDAGDGGSTAQVFVNSNGQSTQAWYSSSDDQGALSLDLSSVAGHSDVTVQLVYTDFGSGWWQADDITVGDRTCVPVPGGLVYGHVTDKNTGAGVRTATVAGPGGSTNVLTTQGDPAQNALYALFVPSGTVQAVTASAPGGYQPVSRNVSVVANALANADFALPAGHLTATPAEVAATVKLGAQTTSTFTVRNTGTAPATIDLHSAPSDTEPATGAPRITGAKVSPVQSRKTFRAAHRARADATPFSPPWTASADYPVAVSDSAAATAPDGTVYSVGGTSPESSDGLLSAGWALDPSTGMWTALPDMPHERYEARAAFLLGKLYVVGGLDPNGDAIAAVDVYDPAAKKWTAGAAMPQPFSSPGIAVVGGQIYVVGGCHDIAQCGQHAVQIYDPAANAWSAAPDYPVDTSWLACGGIGKRLYCAGGANMAGSLAAGYSYDPAADAWTPIAGLPSPLWGASTTAQGGRLLVSGGVMGAGGALTNAGFAYDPSTDAWTSLPNANEASYGAAGACGLYRIGGRVDPTELSQTVEVLPGYGGCSGNGAPAWLSATPATATLPPGASATVTVTFAATTVAQPGSYSAGLTGAENTPYPALQVPVTMTVTPPARWGELSGTVTGRSCSGSTSPLPGATVSVVGWAQQVTVNTDASGHYDVWMDVRNNPLTVYAALDGWSPLGQNVKITKGANTTLDLRLTPDHC